MELRNTMNRKFGLPTLKWTLEIGAVLMQNEKELIGKKSQGLPERLEKEGFHFAFDSIEKALHQIVNNQ